MRSSPRALEPQQREPAMLAPEMARRIELWPIDRLRPYERNARTQPDEQIAQIAASILEFGFTNPILVDSRDGILAGHGRLLAARKLKLTEVPVIILDHLTEAQKRAYVIVDNQLALNAGWDDELLRIELAELQNAQFHLTLIRLADDELARRSAATHQHWPMSGGCWVATRPTSCSPTLPTTLITRVTPRIG